MLDDLIFKGKSLDEALAKASNFFGADKSTLVYVMLEEAPAGEAWIKLTEYPQPQVETDEHDVQPEIDPQAEKLGMDHVRRAVAQRPREQQPRVKRGERRGRGERRDRVEPRDRTPVRRRVERKEDEVVAQPANQHKSELREQSVESLGETERQAYNLVTDILKHSHLEVAVSVVQDQSRMVLNLEGPDRNILLAKKGAVLTAIQYLVNKIIYNKKDKANRIFIDSFGYRISREEELREIALLSAEKVRSTKKEYVLNPMNPYERRLIHLALKDEKDVTTVSRGNGFIKQVSIIPK
jgi:spoIIIJ-associated protein